VAGSRILVLGVAYKKDLGDMRESPAPVLMRRLTSHGANVRWHDPHVTAEQVPDAGGVAVPGELTADELAAADLVVVHTDHAAYDPALIVQHARRVFDTRNLTAGHRADHVFRL
jgi:UDP-N-acetyl-D-glucosamine dehydrogenase